MTSPLAAALERITAHYQPIVDLETGNVAGFETLARIAAADGTVQSIGPIIDQIESDPDLLEQLMRQLLSAIRRDIAPLFARYPGFYVSVNVPPAILGSGKIKAMLGDLGLFHKLDRVVCEITERQALSAQGRAALELARAMHIRVAMDDFGTGQSGISQLLGLNIDVLKIDRSQVVPLMKDPTADRLVRGVVALAALIRARIVAEGVETAAQAFFLHAAGVDYGQGWFWSRALPAEDLPKVIETGFPNWRRDVLARLGENL
jgi:sensor c-di-GMP phosphodiesterase-like protein